MNTPAESTAAQTAVGQTPAAAPRSITSFFSVQGHQSASGESVAPAETPSAAVHDTTRMLRPAQQDLLMRLPQHPLCLPPHVRAAEARVAEPTAETPTAPAVLDTARAAEARTTPPATEKRATPSAPTTENPAAALRCGESSHGRVTSSHCYHTPCRWGPVSALYHTGDIRYHTPYTITTPTRVINF